MNKELISLYTTAMLAVALVFPNFVASISTMPEEVYVVAADLSGNSNYIQSYGDGTFSSQQYIGQVPPYPYFPYGCGMGDFDNDARFDYVIATGWLHPVFPNLYETHIYLYEKLGLGNNFAPPVSVGKWGEGWFAGDFAVADYNKDGKMDFVLTNIESSNSELYLGDGDMTFTHAVLADTSPFEGLGADSADFNNDGNPDFAVAQYNGTTPYYIYVNLGNGDSEFTTTSFEASSAAWGLTAADFDNDGNTDIISGGGFFDNEWYFYKGKGDGTFESGVLLGVPGNMSAYAIDNYDFNNDGNQDLIIACGFSVLYCSGDGDGTFNYGTEITGGSDYVYGISTPPLEMVPIVLGPRARFTWDPKRPFVNEPATFDASMSKPSEDGASIFSYVWDFETDGKIDAYGIAVSHTFSAEGAYLVTLNVTDSQELWDTKTYVIGVGVKAAIEDGVAWLATEQKPDGSWAEFLGATAFAVLKLEEHAVDSKYGYGLSSPFVPDYPYRVHVENGLNYIFAYARLIDISVQPAGNPDTNGNGKGVYFMSGTSLPTYETSVVMMAIAGSRSPDKVVNVPESPIDGWMYKDVLQDSVDYLAFSQNDGDWARGGWGYDDNEQRSDQSCSGWAVFGLGFAESPSYGLSCTIPAFVKTELNTWIDYIQDHIEGDPNHGGAHYFGLSDGAGANILRTGHLLYMMAFVGDTAETPRVQDAVAYLVRHWNDPNFEPGWKGDPADPYYGWVASYQATLNVMKGLYTLGIHEIDGINWQSEFEHVLIAQQRDDGSWPYTLWGDYERLLGTAWALLTLEKVAPPLPAISVYVDIKPSSWPNPMNINSKGTFTVAICGTEDFDVTTIDPSTVKIYIEGLEKGVCPLRWSLEDVATPYTGPLGGGRALSGDGYLDLVFHFDTQSVVKEFGLSVFAGQTIPLIIKGNLREDLSRRGIQGLDYVAVMNPPTILRSKLGLN